MSGAPRDDSRDDGSDAGRGGERLARARAEAAGLDLDELRERDPERWRMLHAVEALRVSPELLAPVGPLLAALYPEVQIYQLPAGRWRRLLLYPPRSAADLARLDDHAPQLVSRLGDRAYYRLVEDRRGLRRELGLPLAPAAWRPDADPSTDAEALVGPFDDEDAARRWGDERVMGTGEGRMTYDTVPQGGAWFADVFPGDPDR